jgi:hypothetical protein
MKKALFVLPLLFVAASAAAEVSKNKTGAGFSGYDNYRQLDVGPVQRVSIKGATGTSDVPVYTAKSRGLKLRRTSQKKAAAMALQLKGSGGRLMNGVPILAGNVIGSLRIVSFDRHVFGVVDGLRKSTLSDDAMGRSLSGQVVRMTGCAIGGPALMQIGPGYMNGISVPLAC